MHAHQSWRAADSVVHRSPQHARHVVHMASKREDYCMDGWRIDDVDMVASQEPGESLAWPPYYRLNGRAARCGSAREWSALPHGRTGRGTLRSRLSPLPSAKRCTVAKHPAREPPPGPQQLHLCCQSNNTRRRCDGHPTLPIRCSSMPLAVSYHPYRSRPVTVEHRGRWQ